MNLYVIECGTQMGIEAHRSITEARAAGDAEFGSRNGPTARLASMADIAWWEGMTGRKASEKLAE